MSIDITIPEAGESITEVQIGEWHKAEGDSVEQDEILVEIETDKASLDLPAPGSGTLTRITKQTGETAEVGDVIGTIDADGSAKSAVKQSADQDDGAAADEDEAASDNERASDAREHQGAQASKAKGESPTPPRESKSATTAPADEKVTKSKEQDTSDDMPEDDDDAEAWSKTDGHPSEAASEQREQEVVPMSRLRKTVAKRLVEIQQTAALLTTFNEIDMSAVIGLRRKFNDHFQRKFDMKLGFMPFFVKASIEALKRVPIVNAEVRGEQIVFKNYFDIGVAVSTEHGLVVPVLRNADELSFAGVERAIADFAGRARAKKLSLDELVGGTFTISNGGVYGSLLSTPIVNPPQSGILGMHAIGDRPVARSGEVVIRPMMYVALSYDHRIVDGEQAVTFLKHVKELIEEPARMLLEI